jgi:hypothetical protein
VAKAKSARKKTTTETTAPKAPSRSRKKAASGIAQVDLPALVTTSLESAETRATALSSESSTWSESSTHIAGSEAVEPSDPHLADDVSASDVMHGNEFVPPRKDRKRKTPATTAPVRIEQHTRLLSPRALVVMVAIAATCGAAAGSLATVALAWLMPSDKTMAASEHGKLTQEVARINAEFAALKANLGSSVQSKTAQSVKGEGSREQPDADTANDTTGSIANAQAPAGTDPQFSIVDGWILRNVYGGTAMVEGRPGLIQVMPGDSLPGVGRVESIKRQDGRWVVVTSKGLIVTR